MTTATVTVREATPADLDGIVSLDEVRSGTAKPDYWTRILDLYGQNGKSGRVALVADAADGTLAGFLFGEVRAWEFGSEPCGWIFSVAASPDHPRSGIATHLCAEAERRFTQMEVHVVRTMVRRNNVPLLAFFRSRGFVGGPFSEMEKNLER